MFISGIHAIEAALEKSRKGVLFVSRNNTRTEKLISLAGQAGIEIVHVQEKELDRLCGSGVKHQGSGFKTLTAPNSRCNLKTIDLKAYLKKLDNKNSMILILDSIMDPHNIGAILRSADQFGVDLIIIPEKCSVRETETVFKTSAGASAYVPIFTVPNLVSAIELCKKEDFWIYGAHLKGESPTSLDMKGRVVLVLGNEEKGIRRLLVEHCDLLVRIPSAGNIDSFNVSVAAGILMYEVRRQQGFNL